MKTYSLIFRTIFVMMLMLQFNIISFGQSQNWKQIDSPFETAIYILHQSSHGYLFGKMNYTNQIFFSNDRGLSWRQLPDDFGKGDHNKFVVREDINGIMYHASKGRISRFNPNTLASQQIIQVGETDFLDFAILKNGNFVLATYRNLFVYSINGSVIHQHSWWTHTAHFLLDPDVEKHYVLNSLGASDKIVEFNNSLSIVSDAKSINTSPSIVRKGQKLYRGKYFSDDGMTWQALNFLPTTEISLNAVGQDGRLFFISKNTLFISDDNGNTLYQKDIPINNTSYVSSDLSGEIVISQSNWNNAKYYLSGDSGNNWQLVPHNMGVPYMLEFTAGVDENLYYLNDYLFQEYYYKRNEFSSWEQSTFPTGLYYRHFVSISDGSTTALSNDGRLFNTNNKGADWQLLTDHDFGGFFGVPIVEKASVLYYVNFDKMYYSQNYGRTWETSIITDTSLLLSFFYDPIQAPNFGTYYRTSGFPNPAQLIYYNYLTEEIIASPEKPEIYSLVTSYNEDILYGLKHEQGKFSLCISKNHGTTFSYKLIEGLNLQPLRVIKTDHLNNIYVYTDKQVFYSIDEGDTWINITPDFPEIYSIRDLQISYDNYIYVSTVGKGILKFKNQLAAPKILKVRVLDDLNKNCAVDGNESSLNSLKVLVNGLSLRQPDQQGLATFRVNTLLNEVRLIYNDDLYDGCDPSYTVEFDVTDTELHLDIPLKVLRYCADPVVGLSVPFLRRCFDNTYSGSVCNEGNIESINTEIEITLDPFFDFISASLPIKSMNGQTLVLDAGHILPGDCQSFHFTVNVNCTAELGQEHCITAYSSTDSDDCGDIPTARDAYVDCQENIGAYDPNDKNIFVNGNRNQTYIEPGDKIEYLIRFQNTGTDTAFTVRIEDPITKKFNVSSLKPVAASHDYTWSVNNGMLVVLFEDIQLVDSFKNEPASHGFIKFEIQLDSLTLRGDDVKNLAGIFFDFNEPIITEEVITAIGQPLSTKELFFESITAFPNPANGLVYISGNVLSDKPQDLMIYNIHGKLVLSQKISHFNNTIDISKCAPGTYMLMMKSGERVYRGKVVKM